jgi:hypothetical protein
VQAVYGFGSQQDLVGDRAAQGGDPFVQNPRASPGGLRRPCAPSALAELVVGNGHGQRGPPGRRASTPLSPTSASWQAMD